LPHDPYNIIVCGVGGQGNVLGARMVGNVLLRQGFQVSIGETFGVSQRGGDVMSHIRVSARRAYGPLIPQGHAHVVVGLEPLEVMRMLAVYGNPGVSCVVNTRAMPPVTVGMGLVEYPGWEELHGSISQLSRRAWYVPATEIALELGAPIVSNIVMLGALAGTNLLPGTIDIYRETVRSILPARVVDLNLQALDRGQAVVQGTAPSPQAHS